MIKNNCEEDNLKGLLGKNIKFFRAHKRFSQANLAEKANISITFLSNIERGNKWPYPETLSKIAKSLNIEVYELFKPELVPDENKQLFDRFCFDISQNVTQSLDAVFNQYKLNIRG